MSIPVETIIGTPEEPFGPPQNEPEETLAESGFYWREAGELRMLVCRPLEEAGFANGFSTRFGGVSPFPANDLNLAGFDEDSAENIEENRRRFLAFFDDGARLTTAWQVHGDAVKLVRTPEDAARTDERFDAIASSLPRILAGVKTADCVPILLGDEALGAFAAIHAGWRGTLLSIAKRTVEAMRIELGAEPGGMVAAIGPAACGKCYEVGHEVIDRFADAFSTSGKYFKPTRPGHALVDLHHANRDQLEESGLKTDNIFTSTFCTMGRSDLFFSYRVEKRLFGRTGRLLSVVGRAI